jgi:hypothetical protein
MKTIWLVGRRRVLGLLLLLLRRRKWLRLPRVEIGIWEYQRLGIISNYCLDGGNLIKSVVNGRLRTLGY